MKSQEKDAIRSEIEVLQAQFPPAKVPARILNGSHQEVVVWKGNVAAPPYHINRTPGRSLSERELIEIRDDLTTYIATIS